jgi:hypothetical protein
MAQTRISADYVIKGAGAAGMAFADSLFTETDATMVIVDRHDRPGGHWNDAYPYVRLHQPASFYGVNSATLGSGAIDQVGLNAGYSELASGQDVLSHFDGVLRQRLLPSGRVRFFPMSELGDDGTVTSLLSGIGSRSRPGRFVDATHSRMQVPSTTAPSYAVSSEVTCVPPNDLPRRAAAFDDYVVIGAGKTGMDACVWLLDQGAPPDRIRWIVPRDSWVLNRRDFQPGDDNFAVSCAGLADQVDAVALATSEAEVFARLEACDVLRRIDPSVTPEAYHCAILSDGELEVLRRITGVVRLGRVLAIHDDRIDLEHGSVPTGATTLHVDCSAAGIPTHPSVPVFDGDRITIQWVRTCQPTFSAAMIGFVEAAFDDEETKNHICQPIAPPTVPRDWLRMFRTELRNRTTWTQFPELGDWQARSRLDPFTATLRARLGVDPVAREHITRYLTSMGPAIEQLDRFLGDEDGMVATSSPTGAPG